MAGSAYIHVVGNVGGDPEVREAGRNDICSFSIAVNTKRSGEDVTTWYRANVWGTKGQGLLDVADRYVRKGAQIAVHGDLATSEWQDRDGNDRTTLEINVRGLVLGSDGGGDRGGRRDDRGRDDDRRGGDRGGDRRGDDRRGGDRRADSRSNSRGGDDRGRGDDRDRGGDRRGGGGSGSSSQRDNRDRTNDLDDEIPF